MAVSEQQREANHARQRRKYQRGDARRLARAHAVRALDAMIVEVAVPDEFTVDQVKTYTDELCGQRDRIGGVRPHFIKRLRPLAPDVSDESERQT